MARSPHGKKTGEFGVWLANFLQSSDLSQKYAVFYDHGDQEKSSDVAALKGIYGRQVKNRNRLADIDVMVANHENDVLLLIEIEETELTPKKLLGDLFSILFCNKVAVGQGNAQNYFAIQPETRLIIAGVVSQRGTKMTQINEMIKLRLEQFTAPSDAVQIENVAFLLAETASDLLRKLEREMRVTFSP